MSTIEVGLEEFKGLAKEFVEALEDPTCTWESADGGFRCLTLAYFGMKEETPSDPIMAQGVYEWAVRKHESFQHDQLFGGALDV